jgi:hypothetical protein
VESALLSRFLQSKRRTISEANKSHILEVIIHENRKNFERRTRKSTRNHKYPLIIRIRIRSCIRRTIRIRISYIRIFIRIRIRSYIRMTIRIRIRSYIRRIIRITIRYTSLIIRIRISRQPVLEEWL